MRLILFVGIGGFIGSILRYLISLPVQNKFLSLFPFGTLLVNIIGCLVIGLLFGLSEKSNLSKEWLLFLATGLCGGFTTFSAFSIETIELLKGGYHFYAISYIISSILLGLSATLAGSAIIKLF